MNLQSQLAAGLIVASVAAFASCGDSDRFTSKLGGVEYGAKCGSDGDCGGVPDSCCNDAVCSPEGWCSPTCASDASCPNGFFCVAFAGSRCFAGCSTDADCPTGFVCDQVNGIFACRYDVPVPPEGGGGADSGDGGGGADGL